MIAFRAFLLKKPVLLISAAATVLLALILTGIENQITGPIGRGAVYLQLSFVKSNFDAILASWGKAGVALFINYLWLDFIYPPSYAFLIASGTQFVTAKLEISGKTTKADSALILLLPFAAAIFDYIENIMHILVLKYNFNSDIMIFSASIASLCKWLLLISSLIIFLKRYFLFRKDMKSQQHN